jgi:hypothetical protein
MAIGRTYKGGGKGINMGEGKKGGKSTKKLRG